MDTDNDIWGDDDDLLWFNTPPELRKRSNKRNDVELNTPEQSSQAIQQEIKEEEDDIWGNDEDELLLCSASQLVEEELNSVPVGKASTSSNLAITTSPTIVEPSRVLSILKLLEKQTKDASKDDQHPWDFSGDESINGAAKNQKLDSQNKNIDYKDRYYTLLGENSTLRRKMDSSIQAKDKQTCERLQKEAEEKQKEKDKLRKAEDEKEYLKSQLASQRMETFRLECIHKFKNRGSASHSQMNQSNMNNSSVAFPNAKSFMAKEVPPIPKFDKTDATKNATPTRTLGTRAPSVTKRLMKMLGKDEEKPTADETENRDFRLLKPATLSDYETDEYQWNCQIISDDDMKSDCFFNLIKSCGEDAMDIDDCSDTSSEPDESINDWEGLLDQNPVPPDPPEELILASKSVDEVIQWMKLDPRDNQTSHTESNKVEEDTQKEEWEKERLDEVANKLMDFKTSRSLWSQTFDYIQKSVENRFEPLRPLVADVSRLALHVIAEVENVPGSVSSELAFPREERRLWKWYLIDMDRKQQDFGRRNSRSPSFMPSNCEPGPSTKFLNFIGSLTNDPVTAWFVLSHVKVQLEDLIWISSGQNEWRIYEKSNLETFLKLLMWTSELWPYVIQEEKSPQVVKYHLPYWQTELKSWTSILLEIGIADYLFEGKFRKTIISLVLDIFAKVLQSGYFHATSDNYKSLSDILKLTCDHLNGDSSDSDVLMNICTILKYGFKDQQFMKLLCGGVNERMCLMDIISTCFLLNYVKEKKPEMKATLFCEYVSTLNLLRQKDSPLHYSSLLARAKLIQKRTNLVIDDYSNEENTDGTAERDSEEVWLHPTNWNNQSIPNESPQLCQCRKVLCGNVILMFSEILPLWRKAINEAEAELLALQNQHKIEEDEFLKQYEIDKMRGLKEGKERKQLEQLRQIYMEQFAEYKILHSNFSDLKLHLFPDEKDAPKVADYIRNLEAYNVKLMKYKEKKSKLIQRRREYKTEIMKQGLLDEEVFSNWTQIGKLLRQRMGIDLPWWLKIYEREPTIFDKALEVGMVFMHQFLKSPNMAVSLGDEGLRDFLILHPILKAYSEDFLITNDIAPTIRELTTIPTKNKSDENVPKNVLSSSLLDPVKMSHKLINKGGGLVFKEVPFEDEHLPDLKQSDINRLQELVIKDTAKHPSQRPPLRSREKQRIMTTDSVIWLRERLKNKSIEEITTPTGCHSNALFGTKRFSLPYRKVNNINEGSPYSNNCEDTIKPRHKRDKILAEKDEGRPYNDFGVISINASEAEISFFDSDDNSSSSGSVTVLDDPEVDKRDWKMFLSK